jgi:hypothetical protein
MTTGASTGNDVKTTETKSGGIAWVFSFFDQKRTVKPGAQIQTPPFVDQARLSFFTPKVPQAVPFLFGDVIRKFRIPTPTFGKFILENVESFVDTNANIWVIVA